MTKSECRDIALALYKTKPDEHQRGTPSYKLWVQTVRQVGEPVRINYGPGLDMKWFYALCIAGIDIDPQPAPFSEMHLFLQNGHTLVARDGDSTTWYIAEIGPGGIYLHYGIPGDRTGWNVDEAGHLAVIEDMSHIVKSR